MSSWCIWVIGIAALLLPLCGPLQAQTPVGTAFTYQGQLKKTGTPVDGLADMIFTLWDDAASGDPNHQIGPTLTFDGLGGNPPPIVVSDGLFTVWLDFGANIFTGQARWLEIAVRSPSGGGVYTTLSPRQALTVAPYALALPGLWTLTDLGDNTPSVVGGYRDNAVSPDDCYGAVIAGGGAPGSTNVAWVSFAAIGGGVGNYVGGLYGTVPGGANNVVQGRYGLAAGRRARANHEGTFVWGDSADADFASTGDNQFLIRAGGNVGINTNSPASPLTVNGMVQSLAAGFKFPDGTVQTTAATGAAPSWILTGNAGTDPNTNFLGTTDNQSLLMKVNNARAMRIEPATSPTWGLIPNIIGGHAANNVDPGVVGAFIGGGGQTPVGYTEGNRVAGDWGVVVGGSDNVASANAFVGGGFGNIAGAMYATVSGGYANDARGWQAVIPGGKLNYALGEDSFAAGTRARAMHNGAFVWGDFTDADFESTAANQFLIRAGGNVGINTNAPGSPLTVAGQVESTTGGFKFPDGSVQTSAAMDAPAAWNLAGNAGTDPNTDFLGTTDNQPLELRVANQRVSRLERAIYDDGSWTYEGVSVETGLEINDVFPGVPAGTIGGGGLVYNGVEQPNRVTDIGGTIAGGVNNQAGDSAGTVTNAMYATVGGGRDNKATGGASSVHGGTENTASAAYATVCGGHQNTASSQGCIVGAGYDNTASGENSVVAGGSENNAIGLESTIGGGSYNSAAGWSSTVPGGLYNHAGGACSFAGGSSAWVRDANEVGGGDWGGDEGTFIWSDHGGGGTFSSTGPNQFLVRATGGVHLTVDALGGGLRVLAAGEWPNLVAGHSDNSVDANAVGATIAGGGASPPFANYVSSSFSTVGGGKGNDAGFWDGTGAYATVAGGLMNGATGENSSVGGGYQCNASGDHATVGGGIGNRAEADSSTVGGGASNHAEGEGSTVPGGSSNRAGGDYSFAAGRYARVRNPDEAGDPNGPGDKGTFVWADSTHASGTYFVSSGRDQFMVRASGGTFIYSDPNLASGVKLTAGSSAWATVCDRNAKVNFAPADGRLVLERLANIPLETWNYKSQDASIRHIGPMAQDFHAAFAVGEDDVSISTVDADGVALAAIQGLYEVVQEKSAEIAALRERLEKLETLVQDLAKMKEGGAR